MNGAGAGPLAVLPETSLSAGDGEIGGLMWRSPYAYYADRVGPFSLKDRLEARGRVVLAVGAPDSGMMLGWFNSEVKKTDDHDPLITQRSYWLENARISYSFDQGIWEVAAFVHNLLNQKYLSDAFDESNPFGFIEDVVGTPRSFGVQLNYRF